MKKNIKTIIKTIILFLIWIAIFLWQPMIAYYGSFLIIAYILFAKRYIVFAMQGNKAHKIKNFDYALNRYRKCVQVSGAKGVVINNYLIMELKYGDAERAMKYIDNNINNKKFDSTTKYSMKVGKSIALWKQHRMYDALSNLKGLLKKEESTYAYETLTSLLLINGSYEEALNYTKMGLKYNNDSNILLSNEAECYYKLENYEKAEELFAPLIESNVNFAEPYYYTGILCAKREENERAMELLEKVIDCNDSLLTTISKDKAQNILSDLYER